MRARRMLLGALLAGLATATPAVRAQEGPAAVAGQTLDDDLVEAAKANPGASQSEDPWEGFNRAMFSTHNFLDATLLVPVSRGYRAVTPKAGRRGVRRFLANLRAPGILLNDLLHGEFGRASDTAARFFINSTIGFGGFADPAQQLGIEPHREDFGQTLAVWGLDSGPYLFIPLFGPGTVRDTVGAGVQIFFDPLFYFRSPPVNTARFTRVSVAGVSAREPLIEPLEELKEGSLDYYATFRSYYLQARQRQILNGRTSFESLPDIGDELDAIEDELEDLQ